MKIIVDWLSEPDYWKGVVIYEQHGTNDFFKKLFKSGINSFNERKLQVELKNLLTERDSSTLPSDEPKVIQEITAPNRFLRKKIDHDLQQVFRSIDNNRYQLARASADKTRKEYAFQILKLYSKKQSLYAEMDYFEEHGCLPSAIKQKVFVTPEIQRLHVQISKTKKRLEKTGELRNRAKTETLLANKLAKLKLLTEERNAI